MKLASFGFQIKYSLSAPCELREQFSNAAVTHQYSLRGSTQEYIVPIRVVAGSGRMFKNFYAQLLNNHLLLCNMFSTFSILEYQKYRIELFKQNNILTKKFVEIFPKFIIKPGMKLFFKKKT